jgi:WD40 repeat protein
MLLSDEERTKTNNLAQSNTGGFGFGGPVLGLGALPASNGGESKNSQENFSIQEEEKETGPQKIKKLFSFYYASLVQGRAVTAMAWNSVNTDILAVSYGRVNFNLDVNSHKLGTPLDEELSGGLVLFWSLRNPEYPEKILRTKQPVTALDFSRFSPMLLAVGCYNGDVMIFDVKREGEDWEKPKESSTTISGGHVEAVWQVKWVSKGSDRLENVVSISTDGNILQWDLKKGLSVQTLMNLKRGGLGDGWISRQAAGLSFDFLHGDPSTYFVGTEEGGVHKCSVSYNEQYLENYESHEGPVYKIRCSNRWPNIFLSCSSDWNIKLFHIRNKKPVLTLHPSGDNDSVVDTVWCPGNSTVFANVTESGKLHIWDLSVSSIDPVVNYDTTVDIEELFPQEETPDISQDVPDVDKIAALKGTRKEFGRNHDAKDEIKESPVAKLLKNLSNKDNVKSSSNSSSSSSSNTNSGKLVRSLTTVLFSEKSPTIVVGDAKGAVTLYRVVDPVTVLLEGPLQQVNRLKTSILTQADPEDAAKLKSFEELGSQNQ